MIDLQIRDLTVTPDDPKYLEYILLGNPEWEKVKAFIKQLKEANMNEHIQTINCYADQIKALLDLMQTSKGADIESINVAAEMCMNMFYDLMDEVERMKEND